MLGGFYEQVVHQELACDQCDYQTTKQSSLTRHIQSKHEGVKYACDQCDYQAARKDSLTKHIQSVHEGVRYGCDHCDSSFTQRHHLNIHMKKHETQYALSKEEPLLANYISKNQIYLSQK